MPFVIERFEPGINLRHLLRQACDMTFLTDILLVLLRQVALKFLRALNTLVQSHNFAQEQLSYHDVQLFLVCLCTATIEHAYEPKNPDQVNQTIVGLQQHVWGSFPGFYQLFKTIPAYSAMKNELREQPVGVRELNRDYEYMTATSQLDTQAQP